MWETMPLSEVQARMEAAEQPGQPGGSGYESEEEEEESEWETASEEDMPEAGAAFSHQPAHPSSSQASTAAAAAGTSVSVFFFWA